MIPIIQIAWGLTKVMKKGPMSSKLNDDFHFLAPHIFFYVFLFIFISFKKTPSVRNARICAGPKASGNCSSNFLVLILRDEGHGDRRTGLVTWRLDPHWTGAWKTGEKLPGLSGREHQGDAVWAVLRKISIKFKGIQYSFELKNGPPVCSHPNLHKL